MGRCGGTMNAHLMNTQKVVAFVLLIALGAGGDLLWKPLECGHVPTPAALKLARAWFSAVLSGTTSPSFIGEDDTGRVVAIKDASRIDIEFRNPLYTDTLKELWQP
jgi:hypothetical protein